MDSAASLASMSQPVPNFFVVGAARAGTTSVDRYLDEHPEIYMSPIKEPSYFARDILPGDVTARQWNRRQRGLEDYLNGPMTAVRGGCVLEWEQYLKLFKNVKNEAAVGESSTAYLVSPQAPAEIRARIPHARIIIMLRSPVERAFSMYLLFCRNGGLRANFSDLLRNGNSPDLAKWRRHILELRKVAPHVRRFLETFPRDQVRWYFYDDFSADPGRTMQNIYTFLGVDPQFRPDVARRFNEGVAPRLPLLQQALHRTRLLDFGSRILPQGARALARRTLFRTKNRPSLTDSDRAYLVDYFRDDIVELEQLVQRDLSGWLQL